MSWVKKCLWEIWKGILNNLGVLILATILSGGYLYAINMFKKLKIMIRNIPTDYVFTPLVLLVIVLIVVLKIYYKQRKQLGLLKPQLSTDERKGHFVTHVGVWWKVFPDSNYIEDFPYCSCCEPKQKLVQTDWYPDEKYKCPKTGTEFKLYDEIPHKKKRILEGLYRAYFGGGWVGDLITKEYRRIKDLDPNLSDHDILNQIFSIEPLNRIPRSEIEVILERFSKIHEVIYFIEHNYTKYRKYLKLQREKSHGNTP